MKFDNDCDVLRRHFYVQNVTGHRYSWNKYFVTYQTNAADVAAYRNTSQVLFKLKIRLLQYLSVLQ